MFGGNDIKRIAENRRPAMGSRSQPYNLRTERDRLVVPVLCPVIQSNLYAHPSSCGSRLEFLAPHHSSLQPVDAPWSRESRSCKATLTQAQTPQFSGHSAKLPE